jgi:organic hydroperoxide reductase OsmC/OhrA
MGGMSSYSAVVTWERDGAPFLDNRYSRAHRWTFDGGVTVPASSSPHVVPVPMSRADAVDPEEAFVASLSSCHMLTFLWIAGRHGFVVDSYHDEAVGVLGKDGDGRLAMTSVALHPVVAFAGDRVPAVEEHEAMHHEAHDQCFIAQSVKTPVRCDPVIRGV